MAHFALEIWESLLRLLNIPLRIHGCLVYLATWKPHTSTIHGSVNIPGNHGSVMGMWKGWEKNMLPTSISSIPVTFLKQEGVKTNPMYMVGYTWCRLHFLVGNQYLRFYKVPSSQTPRLHNPNTQWNSSKVLILNLPLTLWDSCHHKQITTTIKIPWSSWCQPLCMFQTGLLSTCFTRQESTSVLDASCCSRVVNGQPHEGWNWNSTCSILVLLNWLNFQHGSCFSKNGDQPLEQIYSNHCMEAPRQLTVQEH